MTAVMEGGEILNCPFCDYKESSDYQMLLHVEVFHSESGESPFAVKDEMEAAKQLQDTEPVAVASEPHSGRSTPTPVQFVQCPYRCGEQIPADDLQFHTDFHLAEDMANHDAVIDVSNNFSTDISNALRNHDETLTQVQSPTKDKGLISSLKDMFSIPTAKVTASLSTRTSTSEPQRLGKTELGPFAHEKRMPRAIMDLLERGAKVTVSNKIGHDGRIIKVEIISNETPNLVPVLARLSVLDRKVACAFYCNPYVRHVAKLQGEGGFCGYRNIQMLISYIRDAGAPGHEHFDRKRLPSVLRMQEMIENAWDQGFNKSGRVETGGIRWTRKYIGTPEAQAMFLSLGIAAEAQAISMKDKRDAYGLLMQTVCGYLEEGIESDNTDKVVITDRPPLYFQHQGHSMTIVGAELRTDGSANLVVFDPMFNVAKQLRDLAINNKLTFSTPTPEKLMKAHRRDEKYLGRYKAFEIIKINGPGSSETSSKITSWTPAKHLA